MPRTIQSSIAAISILTYAVDEDSRRIKHGAHLQTRTTPSTLVITIEPNSGAKFTCFSLMRYAHADTIFSFGAPKIDTLFTSLQKTPKFDASFTSSQKKTIKAEMKNRETSYVELAFTSSKGELQASVARDPTVSHDLFC